MRHLSSKFTIAVCVFFVAGSAILATGQNSQRPLPPHAVGVTPAPVRSAQPNTQAYATQSSAGPYWTRLINAPPYLWARCYCSLTVAFCSMRSRTAAVPVAPEWITRHGTS